MRPIADTDDLALAYPESFAPCLPDFREDSLLTLPTK